MKRLGQYWSERVAVGECRKKFCLFHAGYPLPCRVRSTVRFEFDGIISSDDFSVYNGYPAGSQQKCLAHLRRHFKKVAKLGHGNNPALGQEFLDLIDEALLNIGWRNPGCELIKIGQWGSSRG